MKHRIVSCLVLVPLMIVLSTTPAYAIFGSIIAAIQRAQMIVNQGVQIYNDAMEKITMNGQLTKLTDQFSHLKEQALGTVGALTQPFTDLSSVPTEFIGAGLSWKNDFTGVAGELAGAVEQLGESGTSFSDAWRDRLTASNTISESDFLSLYANQSPEVGAAASRVYLAAAEAGDKKLVMAHAQSDAAKNLMVAAKEAVSSYEGLRNNTNTSNTALQQAMVAGTVTQGNLTAAMAQLMVYQASQESAREYEQEIARREELARFVEAERQAQITFDAQQAGIAARVDSMREGLLFRVPALYGGTGQSAPMQIQIDPNIPSNVPPEEIRDFQSFIQTALDGLTASAGGEVMTLGTGMFTGLALIVIVIAGVKIAFSGNIQPWEVVRLVIGIWIPWVMMQFYTATIPGMSQTFPGMIAEGGNFLHEMLLGDIISSMQTELGDMVRTIAANMQTQAAQGNVIGILTGGVHAFITAVAGSIILALLILMLIVLFAVTYAQVIWAQIALAILIILGPIFIPFLVFEPLAFLFWGWFKGMLTYSLYAVIAGCVLRVFSAVGIAYITTLGGANLDTQSMTQVGLWTLAVIPLFIAGLLSSLKCGELAAMLVTGGGAAGSGLMGMATTAGMAAASGGAAAAKTAASGGIK